MPAQGHKVYPEHVTPEIAAAVTRGVEYLTSEQRRDGVWRSEGRYGHYPTAMTALCGMALLGSGSTLTRGPHFEPLQRSVDWLLDEAAQPSGLFALPHEEAMCMHGHGFATMFLAQVYGMEEEVERERDIHLALKKAIKLIVRAQTRYGGWYYTPDSADDEGSVTVTQLQALRACRGAGLIAPKQTIDMAVEYITGSRNPDGGIRYKLGRPGESRAPITAAAVAVLYFAGRYDDPMADAAFAFAIERLPPEGTSWHKFYAHLYLAQAAWQRGAGDWDGYYPEMAKWLLEHQRSDGSWMGDQVGATYGTAIALTILQLPYAHLPIYQR